MTDVQPPAPTVPVIDPVAKSSKGPRFRLSAIILGLGIIVALPGVVMYAFGIWHLSFGTSYAIPGTVQLDLGSGDYIVFERTGSVDSYGPVTIQRDRGVSVGSTELTITGPGGRAVAVRNTTPNESVTRDSDRYTAAVEFTSRRSGTYVLRFRGSEPGRVLVQHPMDDIFRGRTPWLVAIGVGWLIALVGMTMLIVGVVRRGRAERRARDALVPIAVASAAWFPDPHGQHRLRYWDGDQWTDHTAD